MLTEARRSYALYRSSHGGDTLCRLKLTDGSGRIFGVVEQRVDQGQRTRIQGWADAACVRVTDASGTRLGQVRPNLQRPDVQQQLKRDHAVFGFDITVPARMDTCIGWRASIMRTMVAPKLPQTASATA